MILIWSTKTVRKGLEMNITAQEYWREVNELADSIACEAMQQADNNREQAEELVNDSLLHEMIDGHQWVIYSGYNLDVLQYSDNDEYMVDNFGGDELVHVLKEQGLSGLHNALAFWALYADVQDKISEALDSYQEKIESEGEDEQAI